MPKLIHSSFSFSPTISATIQSYGIRRLNSLKTTTINKSLNTHSNKLYVHTKWKTYGPTFDTVSHSSRNTTSNRRCHANYRMWIPSDENTQTCVERHVHQKWHDGHQHATSLRTKKIMTSISKIRDASKERDVP